MKLTDFNDLHATEGAGAVLEAIAPAAQISHADDPAPLTPPRMAPEGFPPLIRDIVEAACAASEAHPVAVAANVIAFFCAMTGRGIFQRIGDATIHCRPFFIVCGKSSKARKGTAEHLVRKVFRRACQLLRERLSNDDRLRVHAGGLSSGEGVGYAIRDPKEADDAGKGGDVGVNDKRLLVIEAEFANLLAQVRRETNILSVTLRNLFDGRDIEPLTKSNQIRATRPHVVVIGHITGHELRQKTTADDANSGLLNRFVLLYVFRPKLVALPEPTAEATIDALAKRVADAVLAATDGQLHANNLREMRLSPAAEDLWTARYPQLTRDRDGRGGALLARSELYGRMLAMIFASMEGRLIIEPVDLIAAFAWVEFWHKSVSYVFNVDESEAGIDAFAKAVLDAVTQQPGISLNGLQERWGRKKRREVQTALETLLNLAPPLLESRKDVDTGGRPAIRFYMYGNTPAHVSEKGEKGDKGA